METDYRIIQSDLGVSGSYTTSNKVFGSVINLLPVDTRVQSGRIQSVAVLVSGSSFSGSIDLVFSTEQPTVGLVGSVYTASFDDLKKVISTVSLVAANYGQIGGNTRATVNNLSIPFNSDAVYLSSIYQASTSSVFQSGSVWATIGYELGMSRG